MPYKKPEVRQRCANPMGLRCYLERCPACTDHDYDDTQASTRRLYSSGWKGEPVIRQVVRSFLRPHKHAIPETQDETQRR